MNLGDKGRVAHTIADAVELLLAQPNPLFTPAFCLIAIGIDALSGGKKTKFIEALKAHFSELCKAISPAAFYSKYRSGMLHAYTPKKGYALTEDKEVGDVMVATLQIEGDDRALVGVNVQKLAREFVAFARNTSINSS